MDDLISRQAAIDAILAVTGNSSVRELYEHVQEHGLSDMWSGGVNAAIDTIIALPPAQPEIIRCKECKKVPNCHGCNNLLPKDHYCLKYLRGVETAVYLCPFYCHWANDEERRTDG